MSDASCDLFELFRRTYLPGERTPIRGVWHSVRCAGADHRRVLLRKGQRFPRHEDPLAGWQLVRALDPDIRARIVAMRHRRTQEKLLSRIGGRTPARQRLYREA